ncbi:glycine--tRNA ligase subunit beta [Allochromatium vinosum]|uniref:Glycine--tRNA ligase beta subunit n=1 Tax=Allochromatium vinosum (strain ATCC 17899 / DSM 180 / NBRC 103801 / NCIMB 10441 / D) TaxID=572477 RepID=D3RRJ2_ALLVD|nr:glycine--tRNA ligase subunit beta [Allochromatium vinosum]ADC63904.1 glycyl-tRNA synthetase, beta subunit [Allochromatium vinosum DSM 180]
MSTTDLLIEIGTEELPPIALPVLSRAFTEGVRDQLKTHGIGFETVESFAAPRRLALLVKGIQTRQPDQENVRRGPAVQAAFDAEGQPTKALLGFARSCGVEVEALGREETDKGSWLVHRSITPGRETAQLVPDMTEAALAGLPIPKRMRWGDRSEEFVRPVHWVCLLLGTESIAGTVMGLPTETRTRGHRFHHPAPIAIGQASDYAATLREQGRVEPSFELRRERIREQVMSLAASNRLRARIDPELLDEVTALVEWPQALLCKFDERFLEIPPEVLIETMQSNQKYFPVEDMNGALQARFIAVANIESHDPDQVRAGNERVIRPRFSDAAFFWSQDLKQPLEAFAPRLETVVFQDKLGTQAAKCARVARLGRELAQAIGVDPALVERAAALSKCDLMTAMVFEFPGLQGTMGRYYAERSGEDACVSAAMEDQYRPRFAGDELPTSPCGRALALADRLDTLVGIFGIGLRPTGTKDPYALRRASIAVLRLLIETPLDLDLRDLLERAAAGFPAGLLAEDTVEAVLGYMLERLRGYYSDRVVAVDTVESVIHTGVTNPWDLDRRIVAVTQFRRLPAADALAAANKRIRNILLKADPADLTEGGPNPALLVEVPEQRLAERIAELETRVEPLARARDYVAILETLAELREDVDAFFDEVMVMADDPATRRNRLQLLRSLSALFLRVADISRLQ